jgi:hypothetical protein
VRVREQDREHPAEPTGVAGHRRQVGRRRQAHVLALRHRLRQEGADQLLGQGRERDRLLAQRQMARVHPGEVREVLDVRRLPVGVGLDAPRELALLRPQLPHLPASGSST